MAATSGGGGSSNPGTGARMQLAAVGLQDISLRGPFSFFKAVFRRATPFAAWTDEIAMDFTPGKRSVAEIPKSGDLLADMYLQVTLPAVAGGGTWCANVGYAMLRRVRLLLNDQEIHNFERLWYDLYDRLHTTSEHAAGLSSMVGKAPLSASQPRVLFVPLRMLTCRKGASRAPLPLQAIPRSSFRLDIEFETIGVLLPGATTDPGIQIKLLCDYVELGEPEKTRLLRPQKLLFESAIDSDGLSYYVDSDGTVRDVPSVRVNLGNVRFPVKMLVWVAFEETGQPLFTYIRRPLDRLTVTFNNQERFAQRSGAYFDTVQKYEYTARADPGFLGVYSFAMDATSRYSSGFADFGALSAATLQGNVVPGTPRFKVKVFSVYNNILELGATSGKVVFT